MQHGIRNQYNKKEMGDKSRKIKYRKILGKSKMKNISYSVVSKK